VSGIVAIPAMQSPKCDDGEPSHFSSFSGDTHVGGRGRHARFTLCAHGPIEPVPEFERERLGLAYRSAGRKAPD
jgi:hypothetical protein